MTEMAALPAEKPGAVDVTKGPYTNDANSGNQLDNLLEGSTVELRWTDFDVSLGEMANMDGNCVIENIGMNGSNAGADVSIPANVQILSRITSEKIDPAEAIIANEDAIAWVYIQMLQNYSCFPGWSLFIKSTELLLITYSVPYVVVSIHKLFKKKKKKNHLFLRIAIGGLLLVLVVEDAQELLILSFICIDSLYGF